MRVSTVRLAILLGVALAIGAGIGSGVTTYRQDGAYGLYAGPVGVEYADGVIAVWACPEDVAAGVAHILLGCPVDMTPGSIRQASEDTRDGGRLTPDMVERVRVQSPGTDVTGCRWHDTGDSTVVTCDDETYLEWVA